MYKKEAGEGYFVCLNLFFFTQIHYGIMKYYYNK
ncbi:hypothetical protein EZS27_015712 [termite gut metagenome]|uniref:Uncharacterized protein n=1 Tax=termite gut metagenome TaxID=433724 RepID=A0A5J4RQA3_9ZZZZ